jgi:hypothetical protein
MVISFEGLMSLRTRIVARARARPMPSDSIYFLASAQA